MTCSGLSTQRMAFLVSYGWQLALVISPADMERLASFLSVHLAFQMQE